MNNYDYPLGADTASALWNKKKNKPIEIEATVSITLSKQVKIKIDDYKATEVPDEYYGIMLDYDFSDCDLESAVEEQLYLPGNNKLLMENWDSMTETSKQTAIKDLTDWCVDDFTVIMDSYE